MIERNIWESEFFGREIGRFLPDFVPENPLSEEDFAPFALVQARVSMDNIPLLRYLNLYQFEYVAREVCLEWDLTTHNVSEQMIRLAQESDREELEALFAPAFRYSRFCRPYFTLQEKQRFYRTWIGNAINGDFDDLCLIERSANGQILGGISLKCGAEKAKIGLLAVAENARQQGVGTKLLQQGILWAKKQGVSYLQVSTEIKNFPACSFYLNNGATASDAFHWLYRR